jgi:HNH endonuclease
MTDADCKDLIESKSVPEPNSGCWLWLGFGSPYGRLRVDGKTRRAHRVSFEAFNGPIPHGMAVCHTCDTPPCVNPSHLFVASQRHNIDDCVNKGRIYTKYPSELIEEILASSLSSRSLSDKIGIGDSYIRQIRRGDWRRSFQKEPA